MKNYTLYSNNEHAQRGINLIRSALALADYRMERDKTGSDRLASWCIWHRSRRKAQWHCILCYDGWGEGSIGKWWYLTGQAPSRVIRIVEICVGERARAEANEQIP